MKAARRSSRGSPRRPCGGASRVGWASRPPHPASCRMMLLNVLQPPLRKNVRAGRSNRRAGAHPTRETFAAQRRGAVGLQEDNQVWSFCPYSGQPTCKGTRRPLPVPEGLRKLAGGEASPRARTTGRLDPIASAPAGAVERAVRWKNPPPLRGAFRWPWGSGGSRCAAPPANPRDSQLLTSSLLAPMTPPACRCENPCSARHSFSTAANSAAVIRTPAGGSSPPSRITDSASRCPAAHCRT